MATAQQTSPYDVAHRFVEALRSDRTLIGLWMRTTQDSVEFWLYTEPISTEHELQLYETELLLYREFPELNPEVHVIHSDLYDEGSHFSFAVPPGAEQIPLPR